MKEFRYAYFINISNFLDKKMFDVTENYINLLNRINISQSLAFNIQKQLINRIKNAGVNVVDRGIKRARYRVLLENEVPAALVEVGFLTNKNEAKRLSNSNYRQTLALGVASGVRKYIVTH